MPQNKQRQRKPTQNTSKKRKSRRGTVSSSDDCGESISLADIKNFSTDIKNAWKYINKNRYKKIQTSKGPYKSDRWIWNGAMLIVFFWLWFIAHSYDYNMDYYKCGEGERLYEGPHQVCKNPFYKEGSAWKSEEYLPYGEYGQKPGPLFESAGTVAFIVVMLAGILNHVIYNRRFRP